MRQVGAGLLACLFIAAGDAATDSTQAQAPPVTAQLNRYLAGQYDGVVSELLATTDFGQLLDGLKRDAQPWIDSAPAAERSRRRLVAATYALEAARAAENADWKWVQPVNLQAPAGVPLISPGGAPPAYRAPPAIWWKTAAQLLEWGCALARTGEPSAAERWWHLAAVSVAQRRGDYEFLIGSPWDERGNPEDEIDHLKHVIARFPKEPRFALAQAIAVEWRTWPPSLRRPTRGSSRNITDALRAFEGMRDDDDIGPEAWLRSGALMLRSNSVTRAVEAFDKVEHLTRDRYLVYLAKYFRGQARERQKLTIEAERDYRAALATIPRAISATMALAALLTRAERPGEASAFVEAAVTATPQPVDPWRAYGAADDRFWPQYITQIRAEIRQ